MGKLKFRIIDDNETLELFIQKVENYTDVRLPKNYVLSGKVVGAFLHEKLVAGYMLVTRPSFRSLMFVPNSVKESHAFFQNDQFEFMEVNGLWVGPGVKTPRLQFSFWINVMKNVFLSKKNYLLLMCDSRNKTIQKIHELTNPSILYEGTPDILPGHNTHTSVRIGYTTRWNLILNIPRYVSELKQRERRLSPGFKDRVYLR